MGPNVKFVSAITDAFSNKKNGGQFFFRKKDQKGGGSEGGLVKDHTFALFLTPSLTLNLTRLVTVNRLAANYEAWIHWI